MEHQNHESHFSCTKIAFGGQGHHKFHIPHKQLEGLRSLGFSWTSIAQLLGVSEKTVGRRRDEFEISNHNVTFSEILNDGLNNLVTHVLEVSQNSGERMVQGWFRGRGICIQRWRLRESIAHVDPIGRELRRKVVTKRRAYSVPCAV